jgi:cytosine/adenosine deaminase-related metal-dependent hydrolase
LRLVHLLHGGTGFKVAADRKTMLTMVLRNGRQSVTNSDDGSSLAEGQPADILLLDWDVLDYERLRPDLRADDLLFARAHAQHIRELIVAGRCVVRAGTVLGIDLPAMTEELTARFRSGLAANASFLAALIDLEPALSAHFEGEPSCC